jgi:purine-binding chemotaxis protein CheW
MAQLLTPPGLPSLIAGLLNLRGTAVPIIRIDRLFGAAESPPGLYTPLIILRDTDRPLGVLVSAVDEILTVPEADLVEAGPGATLNGCNIAGAQVQGRTIHLLSTKRLFEESERRVLAEFQVQAQARLRGLETK